MLFDNILNSFAVVIENNFFTNVSRFIGFVFDPIPLLWISLVISLIVFFKCSKKKAMFFASSMICSAGFIYVVKKIIQRTRPLNMLIAETGFSFPSGHSMIAIVFFFGLVYLLVPQKHKKLGTIIALFVSLFIGFSRIYLRVHWFSDVMFGFLFGAIVIILEDFLYKRIKSKETI